MLSNLDKYLKESYADEYLKWDIKLSDFGTSS